MDAPSSSPSQMTVRITSATTSSPPSPSSTSASNPPSVLALVLAPEEAETEEAAAPRRYRYRGSRRWWKRWWELEKKKLEKKKRERERENYWSILINFLKIQTKSKKFKIVTFFFKISVNFYANWPIFYLLYSLTLFKNIVHFHDVKCNLMFKIKYYN